MLKTIKKIVVIKLRDIGDIVLSTPVLGVLDYNCPSPEIVYVLKKEYENFKYLLPYVKEVITYDKNDPFDFIRLIIKLRKYNFDLCVNLHASFRSALIALLSGAKFRLIHNHSGKDFFTSVPLGIIEEPKSIIERDLDTLNPLKLAPVSEEMKKTKLRLNEDYTRYIDDDEVWLTAGLGIGARRDNKMWMKEGFIEVGKKLAADGYRIAVFCSADERGIGEIVAAGIGENAKLYCGLDFLRLAFFINKLRIFIGNDSGLRHIAAGLGIKTLTLFGPENPVEWHPYSREKGHFRISHLAELAAEGVDTFSKKF
ncbi:MAG: glycosyltransferase family 9 protein, partial [Candidatus Goldiibacteriota bacterium]